MLGQLTTAEGVVVISNVKAVQLVQSRTAIGDQAFADIVIWQVPQPLDGSQHLFKYRLAYVVADVCVLRYDNEAGKGDHRHWGEGATPYVFSTPEQLMADFYQDVKRWNDENRDS